MFSIFKIFKRKKIVPHIRLSGIIGSVGRFKQGLNFAGQQEIIEKAFSIKKALAVAISINSPGGSPVQSHLIYSYIKKQAKKNKKKVLIFATTYCLTNITIKESVLLMRITICALFISSVFKLLMPERLMILRLPLTNINNSS